MHGKERELWKSFCRDLGEEAFREIYECTKAAVHTICYRTLRNEDDASDAHPGHSIPGDALSGCLDQAPRRGVPTRRVASPSRSSFRRRSSHVVGQFALPRRALASRASALAFYRVA